MVIKVVLDLFCRCSGQRLIKINLVYVSLGMFVLVEGKN